jgi:hypothetical protein
MFLIDILYKIHFAPFRDFPERGKWAAIFLLSSFLTFVILGILVFILCNVFDFRFFRALPPIIGGLTSFMCYAALVFIFNKVYIVNQRDIGTEFSWPNWYTYSNNGHWLNPFFGYAAYKFG